MNKKIAKNSLYAFSLMLIMNSLVIGAAQENTQAQVVANKSYKNHITKIITGTALLIVSPFMLFNGINKLITPEYFIDGDVINFSYNEFFGQLLTYGSAAAFGSGYMLIKSGLRGYKQVARENARVKNNPSANNCCH